MLILVSNDDGIQSAGLHALAAALQPLGRVVVVAPAREQSATSHSLTMHEPLRAEEVDTDRWAVSGTPADCVYLAVHHLLGQRPDVVVSGVNRGTNLGDDIHYSGTVAAAREAVLMGMPALAVSLQVQNGRPPQWQRAATLGLGVARRLLAAPPAPFVMNLNVPDTDEAAAKPIRVTRMGRRFYHPKVVAQVDPRGRPYYWLGGEHRAFGPDGDTDGYWFERGHPTLTPLQLDLTAGTALDHWRAEFPSP